MTSSWITQKFMDIHRRCGFHGRMSAPNAWLDIRPGLPSVQLGGGIRNDPAQAAGRTWRMDPDRGSFLPDSGSERVASLGTDGSLPVHDHGA